MSKFRIVLVALFIQTALSSQQPSVRASIQGIVVSVSNGQPVADADVELTVVEGGKVVSRTATTRADGRFTFRDLPPGSGYQIVVTGAGLQPSAFGQKGSETPWTPLTLGAGEQRTDLRIAVQSLTGIRGRIQDNKGGPILGANVVALRPGYINGRKVLQSFAYTVSDTRGEYRFSALPIGPYYIRVMPRNSGVPEMVMTSPALIDQSGAGAKSAFKEEPEGYPVVYFPGAGIESAKVIQISDGSRIENIDVPVTKVRTSRVRGTVVHHAKKTPVASAKIFMVRRGNAADSGWTRTADAADGQFDLRGVLPGSYILTAFAPGDPASLWSRVPVDIKEGEPKTVSVTVFPKPAIEGRIVLDDPNPGGTDLSMLSVHLRPNMGGTIDATLSALQISMPMASAQSAANGSFTIREVAPWDYRVALSWGGDENRARRSGAYIKSVRLGARDILADGLQVDTTVAGSLEIVLATNFGGLDGRVTEDRENVPLARVVLVPDTRGRQDLYAFTTTTSTGRFQFQGVAPGAYKLFAWRYAPDGAWLDPDFLERYEKSGTSVLIDENSAEFIEVPVLR
jgi:hypothetical protein